MELERTQALREARQRDMSYRELIDGSAQGIMIHRDWQPLYSNRQCLRIFGYESLEEFQAVVSLEELFDPERFVIDGYAIFAAARSASFADAVNEWT